MYKKAYSINCLFPKNGNSSSSKLACSALTIFRSEDKRYLGRIGCNMEREQKLSVYFIILTVFTSNSIQDKHTCNYLLKALIHGIVKFSLSAILKPLVCCKTQHSNQNTHSQQLKHEFRDITDALANNYLGIYQTVHS